MSKVMQAALRLLTRREYSQHELRQKLLQQFSLEEVDVVLDDLNKRHLLSDERFVESRIRHRLQQGYGPLKIHQDVRQHRVDEDVLSQHMDFDEQFWVNQAIVLIHKKFGQLNLSTIKIKIQRYLHQKGYSVSIIQQALREIENLQ